MRPKAVAIPLDREVIHILPQEYIVDDQRGIADPMGMAGVRLEVKVHIGDRCGHFRPEHRALLP